MKILNKLNKSMLPWKNIKAIAVAAVFCSAMALSLIPIEEAYAAGPCDWSDCADVDARCAPLESLALWYYFNSYVECPGMGYVTNGVENCFDYYEYWENYYWNEYYACLL